MDAQPDQIAAAQLAVDGQVEQGKVAQFAAELEPDPDGPDFLRLQRGFLAAQFAFVPRAAAMFDGIHVTLP